MTGKSGRGTARQTVRIDEDTWDQFGAACDIQHTDRSTVLRHLIAWYLRDRGAKLPNRPERTDT